MKGTSKYTEAELVGGCVKGDPLAQRALYERYAPLMYPVCVRYVGREVAKDVLQDGFITVFDKISTFRGDGSFEGWLRRIFVNTALMEIRKTDVLRNAGDIEDVPIEDAGMKNPEATSSLQAQEILKAIEELPPSFRTVFNLCAIDGFSHAEVARMTGISESSSRSQLSRARNLLQNSLKKLYNDR